VCSERHCYFTKCSSSVSYGLGGGTPKFDRNFCVGFAVLTEDSGLLAYNLLSICQLFVVSGPLLPPSSGSTKFENCIDLKMEVACLSETSVTLPIRDNSQEPESSTGVYYYYYYLFTWSQPAAGLTHSVCCSFPSVNLILPGGDHSLPSSWVLRMRGA
jgi:hypothetical protein